MDDSDLTSLIDRWLAGARGQWRLRFPLPLEERYDADTAHACRVAMALSWLGLYVVAALCFPALCGAMPDVAAILRVAYLGVSIPLGFCAAAFVLVSPQWRWRQAICLVAFTVTAALLGAVMAMSAQGVSPLPVGFGLTWLVAGAIGLNLRFRFAVSAVLVTLASLSLAVLPHGEVALLTRVSLLMLALLAGVALIVMAWRVEQSGRIAYALRLRLYLKRIESGVRPAQPADMAHRDPLTGLASRATFDTWLDMLWTQQRDAGGRLGLIVVDVDRFKFYNEYYGQAQGDACLKKLSLCLREQLRGTTDLVARIGGEEFAVLLPSLPPGICEDVAERIRQAIEAMELPHAGIGAAGIVTASAGVATVIVRSGHSAPELFDAADTALYEAKIGGRNRVCVASLGVAAPRAAAVQ